MPTWFEGLGEIASSVEQIKAAYANHGEFFAGVVGRMPGIKTAELEEVGPDFATVRTNEGLMKRSNIEKRIEVNSVVVEFDEEYQAGRMITVKSHHRNEFNANSGGVNHRVVLSNVEASGLLGFLYRNFGKRSIGRAILKSHKAYFEMP